jgi:hypothetical protein
MGERGAEVVTSVALAGACLGDDDRAPYGADHTQASTRHAQNGSDRLDKPLARPGTMYLGEALERKLESHEIIYLEQGRDRQLCELGGANDQPPELALNIPGNFCFDGRVHVRSGRQPRWPTGLGRCLRHSSFRATSSQGVTCVNDVTRTVAETWCEETFFTAGCVRSPQGAGIVRGRFAGAPCPG